MKRHIRKHIAFVLTLALTMSCAIAAPVLAADKYDGIVAGEWYEAAAKSAVDSGSMTGTSKGFEPSAKLTRGQVVQILYNLAGKPAVGQEKSSFNDVDGKWYRAAAHWASFVGIAAGKSDGSFGGDEVITRAETAQFMADYAKSKNLVADTEGMAMKEAPDYDKIPAEYLDGMTFCYYGGVMTGDQSRNLNPMGELTRAEMAVILKNFSGLKTYIFNPEKPYDNLKSGLFNNVDIAVGENVGIATYYLPVGLQPYRPAVIVMTPDNTTAEAFATGETGLAWRALADAEAIALAFLEPSGGKTWNLSLSETGRDDGAILNQLYMTMRSMGLQTEVPFCMDKSYTALVGYGEGGAAALLFGARNATDFSGICAVDATAIPAKSLSTVGEQLVLPFPGDSDLGLKEMNLKAKTVDIPVWFVNSADKNADALKYFIASNDAKKAAKNDYAETTYQASDSVARIWVSAKAQTPKAIYTAFLGTTARFMGMQEGGRLAFANDFTKPQYKIYEEMVNGEPRRWMTYVPTSYTGAKDVPLVVAIHGYTSSMYALAEESRWYDLAEKNGFIVVFPQALVRPSDLMGNIPASIWCAGNCIGALPELDVMTDVNFINALLDKTEAEYKIDDSRIYATGHSNGSMMTWDMGVRATERFAAIAPIGFVVKPVSEFSSKALLPTWTMMGDFETWGNLDMVDGNINVTTIKAWNEHNGVDETKRSESTQFNGRWETATFSNQAGVPLVQITLVKNTPHVYMPEQSQMIWENFFSKYTRGEDGTLYYEGKAVKADTHVSSDGWYAPAAK